MDASGHPKRTLLYVRQSSLKQVIHNTESAVRQYDLRGKAIALGWDASQITVIDIDQGQSGASAADREGFQQLVAEVSLGRAGIVLGLECSRLARNSADWHQLLELCGMTGTLICDEDGLYDPRNFNDRLLLGLKGALSEAELHFIRARLRGGQLSKARRGELIMPLPIGLIYDAAGHVILDPDTAIQGALRHLFTTFQATGSATACVKAFRAAGLSFPWRHHKGPRKGEVDWQPLRHHAVLRVLPSTISSRWNSSIAPRIWKTSRPVGVVVSICCLRTTRPAPRSRSSSASASRCLSDRMARDRRVMTSTSPSRR